MKIVVEYFFAALMGIIITLLALKGPTILYNFAEYVINSSYVYYIISGLIGILIVIGIGQYEYKKRNY